MPWSFLRQHSDWLRQLEHGLKNQIRWSRTGYQERAEDKRRFFQAYPMLQAQEQLWLTRYPGLESLKSRCDLFRYRENLNLLQALEQIGPVAAPPGRCCHVLEVGPKNGCTVDGLAAYLRVHTTHGFTLTGMELDPWQVYGNGFSRWDTAQAFARYVPEACYWAQDMLAHCGPRYDLIVVILPFVFAETLTGWGLPQQYFQPEAFFRHLVETLLAPGGELVLINQTQAEFERQRALLAPYAMAERFAAPLAQDFYPWKHPRYGWRLQKEHAPTAGACLESVSGSGEA